MIKTHFSKINKSEQSLIEKDSIENIGLARKNDQFYTNKKEKKFYRKYIQKVIQFYFNSISYYP